MRTTRLRSVMCCLFLGLDLQLLAYSPIATVSSSDRFSVDGHAVAASGPTTTVSAPLTVGHEVATSTAPAVLFFMDGSSVTLAAGSRARLTGSEAQPKLILLGGSLDYKVVLGSNLSVTNLDLERKSAKPATRSAQAAVKM